MHPVLRNILAVVAGALAGGLLNMSIILAGPHLISPPAGVDMTTMEGLKASMHLLQPQHYIMPFLAHAAGTFVGAYLTARIAVTWKQTLAILVALLFFAGGATDAIMLPAPHWFIALDLGLAYLPMGWLAARSFRVKQAS